MEKKGIDSHGCCDSKPGMPVRVKVIKLEWLKISMVETAGGLKKFRHLPMRHEW
jgi:hypothetical protein